MFRLLFSLLVLLTTCQRTSLPPHSSHLRINIGTDPQTLDPRKARDLTAFTLIRMLFEGLTRASQSGEIEMALAKEVEMSEDGLQYIFQLRKSVWSNGDPVTSSDFVESWKSILDPKFPSDMAYQLYVIKNARRAKMGEASVQEIGVHAPDPLTLVVELEKPVPYFLELVSMPTFFPIPHKVAISHSDWALQPQLHVGNGPFALSSWQHGDQIHVKKNPRYWEAKKVSLEGIDLFMIPGDTEMRMFDEGELDWAGSPLSTIPIDAVKALRKSERLHVNPFSATYFYRINTAEKIKGEKNPLSNPLFRRALAVCLDRKKITDHVLQGGQIPAKGLVPPEMGLSVQGYFQDDHRDQAKALLMDALTKLDLTLDRLEPLTISYCSSERNATIAQAVQSQWQEGLGIRIALEAVEPKVFFEKIAQQEFQLAAGSWTADFNDSVNFLEVFKYKDASTNNTNWENGKYIELLNQSALCKGQEERKVLLRQAEQILMEQMPIIPVFHFVLNYLQKSTLVDVALSPLGQIDFRWAHLEKN